MNHIKILSLLLIIVMIISQFSVGMAEGIHPAEAASVAWAHLLEHGGFPEDLISDFSVFSYRFFTIRSDENTGIDMSVERMSVIFKRWTDDLDMDLAEFEIVLDPLTGRVEYCNCCDYTVQDLKDEEQYVRETMESWTYAKIWEKKYGPYQLWSVEVNAAFCREYLYSPYVTRSRFFQSQRYDELPEDTVMQPAEALKIAKDGLKQNIYLDGSSSATESEEDGAWRALPSDQPEQYVESLAYGGHYKYVSEEVLRNHDRGFMSDYRFTFYEQYKDYYDVYLYKPAFQVYVNSCTREFLIVRGVTRYMVNDSYLPEYLTGL